MRKTKTIAKKPRQPFRRILAAVLCILLIGGFAYYYYTRLSVLPGSAGPADCRVPKLYTYKVVDTYPHDPNAFTQGLVFEKGVLYEGTGLRGSSTLRKVELKSGRVQQIYKLPGRFFGEGITIRGDKVIEALSHRNLPRPDRRSARVLVSLLGGDSRIISICWCL